MKLKAFALLVAVFVSVPSFAGCIDYLKDYSQGVTTKGYVSAAPINDPRGYEFQKSGLIGWGLSTYIKPSIEAAKAHYELKEAAANVAKTKGDLEKETDPEKKKKLEAQIKKGEDFLKTDINKDPLTKGMYLIADVPANFDDLSNEEKLKIYKEIFPKSKAIYFHHETGNLVEVSEEQKKVFDLDRLIVDYLGIAEGTWFSFPGWVFPKIRGALVLDKETIGGSTYKNLKNQARKFERLGYTFHFNYNFRKSLEMARDQARIGQSVDENRFKRFPALFEATLKNYEIGRAFSVDMVDRHGNIKGGIICIRNGNIVAINTIFYDPPNEEDVNLQGKTEEEIKEILARPLLDYAKIVVLPLIDRLKETGVIEFIDMGMVSPYSRSLKADYISSDQFLGLLAKLPKDDLNINLSGTWKAPQGGSAK